jgi:hypothetical protein
VACDDVVTQLVQLGALLVALELRAALARHGIAPRRSDDTTK